MRRKGYLWIAHQEPPGHAKMNNPLQLFVVVWFRRPLSPMLNIPILKVEDDMLANAAHPFNLPPLEQLEHLRGGRLEGLGFETEPHRLDPMAADSLIHSISNSLDLGKFRHSRTIFSKPGIRSKIA